MNEWLREQIRQALAALQKGEWPRAVTYLETALEMDAALSVPVPQEKNK